MDKKIDEIIFTHRDVSFDGVWSFPSCVGFEYFIKNKIPCLIYYYVSGNKGCILESKYYEEIDGKIELVKVENDENIKISAERVGRAIKISLYLVDKKEG